MLSVLGIKINKLGLKKLLKEVDNFLVGDKNAYIVTPNPEIILSAGKDEELFYILNQADISLADGFGVVIASWLKGHKVRRITGSNLCPIILERAKKSNWKILVINNKDGLSSKYDIEDYLNKTYPGLKYLVLDLDRKENLNNNNIEEINKFSPQIMFCTFGSPNQEKFIYFNKNKILNLKLSLAIGGSFDFLTKKIKRAPRFLQVLGLEWLWRLILQPKRIKRIYNATFVFLKKIIKASFNHYQYRKNVACLLFREHNNTNQILVVEREDEKDHWQIPQGGTDGESLKKAAKREMEEELNTDKFRVLKTYRNLYSYLFPSVNMERSRASMKGFNKHYEFKGQKQGLAIAKYYGNSEEIKVNFWEHVNYKWVDMDDFLNTLHQVRKKSGSIYLTKLKEFLKNN